MWRPHNTGETRTDVPDQQVPTTSSLLWLWTQLGVTALIVGTGGWLIAQSGVAISINTGLSETIVGMLFLAVATSFPELVTALAAVRHGALTLAIGGVVGGNAFDTLLLAFSDFAYRSGTIYGAISQRQIFLMALTIFLTAILLMGLVRREKRGIANIGFESFLILVFYCGALVFLFLFEHRL